MKHANDLFLHLAVALHENAAIYQYFDLRVRETKTREVGSTAIIPFLGYHSRSAVAYRTVRYRERQQSEYNVSQSERYPFEIGTCREHM